MFDKKLVIRILQFLIPYRLTLLAAMPCMVMVAAFSSAQAYIIKPLLDKIFVEQNEKALNILPLILIGIFLLKGVFYFFYTVLLEKTGQSVVRDLRQKIFDHVHSLSSSFFHNTPTGELISRVISDVTLVQTAVSNAFVSILKDLLQALGLLGLIFYQNWILASMSMIFLPLSIVPIIFFGRIYRKLSTQNQQTMAVMSNTLHETIGGNRIVKAFCMEKYESGRFAKIISRLLTVIIKEVKARSISHSFMELLGGIFVAWVIWYGGREVLNGESTPGTFFSFLTALVMIYEPIKNISRTNSTVQQGLAAAVRIFTILDTAPDIVDKPGAATLPPLKDGIEFKNVSFSYNKNEPILTDISLKVKSGELLAIVGSSGGGKTTLANLLPRFYDVQGGSILIDGHDIRDVTLRSLRGQIAMVTQETILFNDTVRNNIAYGDVQKTDEEIRAAAKAAYALDFIMQLPQGFDTIIGESGAKLSGGQRQRLSIARALLKNAPILILDEATSALDTESEREVQKALENLMKGRTTFVIAHRLSTIRKADRIIVLQEGRIAEEGNHDDLLRNNGLYKTLHHMQH